MKKSLLLFGFVFTSGVFAQTYQVSTAAGNGFQGNVNGPAANSEVRQPYGVSTDNDSVLYFADTQNHSVRKLNYLTNVVSLVAGTGTAGYLDGVGTSAKFNGPGGVFYAAGYVYVVESCGRIRKIDLNNNNTVSTVAGTGVAGFQNGAVTSAKFNNPLSIWVDTNGDIYVADYFNHCIRLISGGMVTTFAGVPNSSGLVNGSALSAKFNLPRQIIKDPKGDFYIGELGNNVLRKISGGQVSTFSGNGTQASVDGNSTSASFSHPGGICSAPFGYFYVTDGTGQKIRKVDSLGNVVTIAGNGTTGFADGPGVSAEFSRPEAICYDKHGALYVGDPDNERVRKIIVPEVYGIKSIDRSNLVMLMPNPAVGQVSIELVKGTALNYVLRNELGEVKSKGIVNEYSNRLDISCLPAGNYFITFSDNETVFTKKLVVQK